MNLVLIGYRGTGKTEVSRLLSDHLRRERVGMDEFLVQRFGSPIPAFVESHGWDAFRDEESKLVQELSARDDLVLDCGGGVIVRDANIEALRSTGHVVWLKASVDTIARRIEGDTQRPSLTGTKSFVDEVAEVLAVRIPLYTKAAHTIIDTDDLTPSQVAEQILAWWSTLERTT